MATLSCGIALWRRRGGRVEILLAHMGGPFWASKDDGAWSIPKGLPDEGEAPVDAAIREFGEELGIPFPGTATDLVALGTVRQSSAKTVAAWAFAASSVEDPAYGPHLPAGAELPTVVSNTFEMEWPPRSGRTQSFPEIDRAAWFDLDTARVKCVRGQIGLVDAIEQLTQRDERDP